MRKPQTLPKREGLGIFDTRTGGLITEDWTSELGDAFFSLICIANSTNVNLEDALQQALRKYEQRLVRKGGADSE
ncbi:MAG: MazG nucleotide pyrophosphohydrolase domain-containing protein [Candidatus Bipolaricaulia bacterium]